MRLSTTLSLLLACAAACHAQQSDPGFQVPGLNGPAKPGEGFRVPGLRGPGIDDIAPVEDCEVIARVNGQAVTACEVMWLVNLQVEGKIDRVPEENRPKVRDRLMRNHLLSMLDMKMLYADFRRRAPQVDLKAIQESLVEQFHKEEIPKLMKQVGVKDRKELPTRLVELGTSLRDRRQDYFQTMIARGWMQEQIEYSREVPRDELLAWYREHADEYAYPTQARWEELVVLFSRHKSKAEAYAKLAAIGNEAYQAAVAQADKTGPAFGEIAKSQSEGFNADEGGLYDWTTEGSLASDRVNHALFTLPIGEMSPILESDLGFHILRVVERREAGRTPFTELQTEIRKKIIDARNEVAFNAKLDELRRRTRIWTKWDGHVDPTEYANARAPKDTQTR